MVDLALLQSVSYIAGALGVCVAAVYYVLNMKITIETRRIGLIENIATRQSTVEATKRFYEQMNYEWSDYEDFDRKYGSENNPEAAANRFAILNDYNTMGMMLRRGLVSVEELYNMGLFSATFFWGKYRPIIEESRRRYVGRLFCSEVEYLVGEMLKYMQSKEPSYRIPEKLEKYDPDK
jgi:hypothetical protein